MKQPLVLVAGLLLSIGAGPALAFDNMEGCDLVAFAAKEAPVAIPPARWRAYRERSLALLSEPLSGAANDWRGLALALIEVQKTLLAPDNGSKPYQDYLTGESCRLLSKLDSSAIDRLLDEVGRTVPEQPANSLRRVTQAARTRIDTIERSARFRSKRDQTATAAGYYCFIAGAIAALLPPEREQDITLDSFGTTISCQDIGRTG